MLDASTPIRAAVSAALHFTREQLRFILILAAAGAALTALITILGAMTPALALVSVIASGGVQAFFYAALTAAALSGAAAARAGWLGNGLRVWGAMAVIGFFLLIVFFVVSIPVTIALFSGPLASYLPQLESAGGDQAAIMSIMTRFAEDNPGAMLLVLIFYVALWLYLTSRLYVSAPASLDQKRILTFETWAWTKSATFKIIGARLLLLLPANILAGALGYVVGLVVGIDALAPDASAGAPALLVYTFFASFFRFALYFALEAALSVAFYRALRPDDAPRPAS